MMPCIQRNLMLLNYKKAVQGSIVFGLHDKGAKIQIAGFRSFVHSRKRNNKWPFQVKKRNFGQAASQTHPHLIADGEVTPGISRTEYKQRRCTLASNALQTFLGVKSCQDHLFILPSAQTAYMTNDIPYVFRQNTDFLYYCGFQEPDSLLLIEVNTGSADGEHKASLFVPKRDPSKELWDGPRSGSNGAVTLTGVDAAFNSSELEKYLHLYNHNHKDYVLWYDQNGHSHTDFHNWVVSLLMSDKRHKCVENPVSVVHKQRLIKSEAEARLMSRSCEIASEAFKETMKFSYSGINESHIWAKMDFECRIQGAEFLAYPPVVAGGDRANIIHYITNNQVVQGGEMVLMDAGCELHGYASDLTRTWPVNGVFSPAQRAVYEACLRVQEACLDMCTPHTSLDQVYLAMLRLIVDELTELGIIPAKASASEKQQLARKFCPHHVSHYLGMDVHDTATCSRRAPLQPGAVVTVEPGIYIRSDDFSVSPEFRGIGVRIEDNILVTKNKPVNLSASCPRTVVEIEELMSNK